MFRIARKCRGVLPQQPPIIFAQAAKFISLTLFPSLCNFKRQPEPPKEFVELTEILPQENLYEVRQFSLTALNSKVLEHLLSIAPQETN